LPAKSYIQAIFESKDRTAAVGREIDIERFLSYRKSVIIEVNMKLFSYALVIISLILSACGEDNESQSTVSTSTTYDSMSSNAVVKNKLSCIDVIEFETAVSNCVAAAKQGDKYEAKRQANIMLESCKRMAGKKTAKCNLDGKVKEYVPLTIDECNKEHVALMINIEKLP